MRASAALLAAVFTAWAWHAWLQPESLRAWLETLPGCG